MKLVVLITAEVEKGLDVAQAWQEAGAPGVTIIRTHGLYTLQKQTQQGEVELPRMLASMSGALAAMIDQLEERGEMLLSLVDAPMVESLIQAASSVLGDLNKPNHGILFVIDIEQAIGVRQHGDTR
jgi:nitrogen regulatory protein PII